MAEAPKKGRLTLYEDLLSDQTVAEMKARDAQVQAEEAKKKKDASLMFKPTNLGKKNTKPSSKPKPTFASMHKMSSSTSTTTAAPTITASSPEGHQPFSTPQPLPQSQAAMGQKRGFSDWLANEDEDWMYTDQPKRERGGRKARKKKNKQAQEQTWSWDDIYDPTVPVSFLDFAKSDEQFAMNDAWKRRLYKAHDKEMQRKGKSVSRGYSEESEGYRPAMGRKYPPPGGRAFAPPARYDSELESRSESLRPSSPRRANDVAQGFEAETGRPAFDPQSEDSHNHIGGKERDTSQATAGWPVASPSQPSPVPSAPPAPQKSPGNDAAAAKAAAQIAAFKAKLAAKAAASGPVQPAAAPAAPHTSPTILQPTPPPPPPSDSFESIDPPRAGTGTPNEQPDATPAPTGVVQAAPVYNPEYLRMKAAKEAAGSAEESLHSGEATPDVDVPRSSVPGQQGFAERYMKKYGIEKGQGLGKEGQGITTALKVQQQKRKKRSDNEGGGFATPAMGKIVGGKQSKAASQAQEDGTAGMSEVVKLEGMLAGMDVDKEVQDNDLLQEIGEEMGEFGKVERIFIWRQHVGGNDEVFVKFTSPLSAMNCIKGMDGTEFGENVMKAGYWDAEKFAREQYV